MSNENRLKFEDALMAAATGLERAMEQAAKDAVQQDGEFITVAALRDLIVQVVINEPTYARKVTLTRLLDGLRILRARERQWERAAVKAAKAAARHEREALRRN